MRRWWKSVGLSDEGAIVGVGELIWTELGQSDICCGGDDSGGGGVGG